MLALHRYRALVGPCGHYLPTSTAVENEYAFTGVVRRCHACTAAGMAADAHKDSPQPRALLYGAERRVSRG